MSSGSPADPPGAIPVRQSPRSGSGLGIERGNYIALQASEPAAAAAFAVEHMGLSLVHVDAVENHYLAAHGPDPYSLVYCPGEAGVVDHISFAVADDAALATAEEALLAAGIRRERIDASPLWRHQAAVRFKTFDGATIELTPGVAAAAPIAELVAQPAAPAPAPLTFDHAIMRQADIRSGLDCAVDLLGLRESGRILAPDGVPILAFFRGGILFHCYGVARSDRNGLHHFQFSLKNDRAVIDAHRAMSASGEVEILWGPVRHGCGQNVAFYFRDQVGNVVEYSAEEELILVDETYEVLQWPVQNQRATDEWGTEPPDAIKG
jgi:catechol 2,3-dioxygenase